VTRGTTAQSYLEQNVAGVRLVLAASANEAGRRFEAGEADAWVADAGVLQNYILTTASGDGDSTGSGTGSVSARGGGIQMASQIADPQFYAVPVPQDAPREHTELLNRAILQFYSGQAQARLQQLYFGIADDQSGDDSQPQQLVSAVYSYVLALFGVAIGLGVLGVAIGLVANGYFSLVGRPVARQDWASGNSVKRVGVTSGLSVVGGRSGVSSDRESSSSSSRGATLSRRMSRRLDTGLPLIGWGRVTRPTGGNGESNGNINTDGGEGGGDEVGDHVSSLSPLSHLHRQQNQHGAANKCARNNSSRGEAVMQQGTQGGASLADEADNVLNRHFGSGSSDKGSSLSIESRARQLARATDAPEFRRQQRMLAAELETAVGTHPADLLFDVYQNVNRLAQQGLLQRAANSLYVVAGAEDRSGPVLRRARRRRPGPHTDGDSANMSRDSGGAPNRPSDSTAPGI